MKRKSPPVPSPPSSESGVTLVELLVALVISGLFVPLIWTTIRGSIQFFEATVWQVQLERDLDRLTTLITSEANDACQLGTNAASLPADCVPAADFTCDTAQRNQLRMRVTLLDANNAPAGTRVIRYFRPGGGTNLERNGPAVLANGQLDPNNNNNRQLLMRGVTTFRTTLNDDCTSATVQLTVAPVAPNTFTPTQGLGNPVTRTIGLRTGSRPFVD